MKLEEGGVVTGKIVFHYPGPRHRANVDRSSLCETGKDGNE
ncbi:MAG: hypothetical protein PHC92_09055 [Syntrophomonadaceae bacterium]|nr:hypothetical protein [Syntrophomonadaceae bacterium]MDD3024423.1 hypothetical protein [Syntrophomonadaceae bacterium]